MSVDTVERYRYYTCHLSSSDPNKIHCTPLQSQQPQQTDSSISLSTLFPEWTDRWRLNLRFPSQRVVNDSIDKKVQYMAKQIMKNAQPMIKEFADKYSGMAA
jgi:hypothetical protein